MRRRLRQDRRLRMMGRDCLVSSTPSLFPLFPLCALLCCNVENLLFGSSLSSLAPSPQYIRFLISSPTHTPSPFLLSHTPQQKHKAYPASQIQKTPPTVTLKTAPPPSPLTTTRAHRYGRQTEGALVPGPPATRRGPPSSRACSMPSRSFIRFSSCEYFSLHVGFALSLKWGCDEVSAAR